MRGVHLAEVRRVSGSDLLFDLQEERISAPVALHVNAVVAQTDGAGADDLEGDVERRVLYEEMSTLGLEALGIGGERVEDVAGGLAMHAREVGCDGLEYPPACPGARHEFRGRRAGAGGLRFGERNGECFEAVCWSCALSHAQHLR